MGAFLKDVSLTQGECQLVILALAELSLERPGWLSACSDLAEKFYPHPAEAGSGLFDGFRQLHSYNLQQALIRDLPDA